MKNSNRLFNILNFAAIEIAGARAGEFLQGQFTCDIRSLNPGQAILGACCDHKGRILANGWVAQWQENFILFLPQTMLAMTIEHLQKFAVFSKVSLQPKSDWGGVVYCGDPLPQLQKSSLIHGQLSNLHWLIGPESSLRPWRETYPLMEPSALPHLLVEARAVFIQPATRALFIPQMIELEKIGGVSFSKGCYVGQEVIARTQHLGQLKRHLQKARIIDGAPPQIGDPLLDHQNETVGHIATVGEDPQGGHSLLAVIQDRALTTTIFHKGSQVFT
jgi:tRNA-modifying protein YgfZ